MLEVIKVKDLEIYIYRKEIKNTYLRIRINSGRIEVSTPKDTMNEDVEKLILEKEDWIREKLLEISNNIYIDEVIIENGRKLYLFGEPYTLRINYIDKYPMYVNKTKDEITLNIKKDTKINRREYILKEWYRDELKKVVESIILKWEKIMNINVKEWYTKDMKTRWGTCNPDHKRIWINLNLVKLPEKYLEYIIVHEMIHFFHRGHDVEFYSTMNKYMDNWKKLQDGLDRYIIL